jgi:hypothetical protein
MKSIPAIAICLTGALGLALLVPATGGATPGTSAAGACTAHSGTHTFSITLTVSGQGTPSVSPTTNQNGTCVQGGDAVSVNTSSLPAGAAWSFTFAVNVSLFQNGCQLGNGSGQQSSCRVVSTPAPFTYTYQVTVNGNSIDPRIIVKGTGMPATNGILNRSSDRHSLAAVMSNPKSSY